MKTQPLQIPIWEEILRLRNSSLYCQDCSASDCEIIIYLGVQSSGNLFKDLVESRGERLFEKVLLKITVQHGWYACGDKESVEFSFKRLYRRKYEGTSSMKPWFDRVQNLIKGFRIDKQGAIFSHNAILDKLEEELRRRGLDVNPSDTT